MYGNVPANPNMFDFVHENYGKSVCIILPSPIYTEWRLRDFCPDWKQRLTGI